MIFTTVCVLDFDEDGVCDQEDNDDDNDGVDDSEDCQPFNASVYPGATEIEDGIDNNCDGQIDEGFCDLDFDGDGICDEDDEDDDNDGFNDSEDCQPFGPTIYPGATEIQNGLDDNCDGLVDEGFCDEAYATIVYGSDEWAVENACNVTYRDGTPIPYINSLSSFSSLTTGAWTYVGTSPSRVRKLYNWYAVQGIHDDDSNTPNKEFAPEGWHVATFQELTDLRDYLIANGYNYDGTTQGNHIAKAMASTTGWELGSGGYDTPGLEPENNNSSGFNAYPDGYCAYWDGGNIIDFHIGDYATFRTGTGTWIYRISNSYSGLDYRSDVSSHPKWHAMSVRLVKD